MVQLSNLNSTMETRDHSKNGASLKSLMSRGNFFVKICFVLLMASFILSGCSKDDDKDKESSLLIGTWESVGYYNNMVNGNYYPETTKDPIPDTSEKITFKKNGEGEYEANGNKKEFTWDYEYPGVSISIAASIHNYDNWNYPDRECDITSTQLVIFWANARQVVYKKVK